jgi:ribosomal protein S4E
VLPGARGQLKPARREDAQHVSVRKQSDVALDRARPGDHSIHSCVHLLRPRWSIIRNVLGWIG